jgi:hypothetical protein
MWILDFLFWKMTKVNQGVLNFVSKQRSVPTFLTFYQKLSWNSKFVPKLAQLLPCQAKPFHMYYYFILLHSRTLLLPDITGYQFSDQIFFHVFFSRNISWKNLPTLEVLLLDRIYIVSFLLRNKLCSENK